MKNLNGLREQRAANAAAIREAKAECARLRAEFDAMTPAERVDYVKNTPRELRIVREWEAADKKAEHLQKIGCILKSNYKSILAAQVLPVLGDLLQKYKGKKAGEKTLAKFRDELTKAAGVSVYFERGILSQKSTHASIYEIIDGFRGGETFDIYTKNGASFINENNEFCGLYASDFQAGYIADYIDDPEKRLDEIEQAAAEVKRITAEYNAAADAYNALTVDGFEHIRRI